MCEYPDTLNYDLTNCPEFLEEYDRIQDSMAVNSTPQDTIFNNLNDGLNYYLKQLPHNESITSPPWYTEYDPLVYLGVFVLLLVIYKLKQK